MGIERLFLQRLFLGPGWRRPASCTTAGTLHPSAALPPSPSAARALRLGAFAGLLDGSGADIVQCMFVPKMGFFERLILVHSLLKQYWHFPDCIYIHTYIYNLENICLYVCMCVSVCMYMGLCVCVCVYVYVSVCDYLCMCYEVCSSCQLSGSKHVTSFGKQYVFCSFFNSLAGCQANNVPSWKVI